MRPSQACLELVKSFEGLRLEAYADQGGVYTLGWGHTAGIKQGDTCTLDQARTWLDEDLQKAMDCIISATDCALTQNEADGLCSLVFNIGCGNFMHSTLRMCLSKGDYAGAAKQFLRWNHVLGKTVEGLTRRREAEMALFNAQS